MRVFVLGVALISMVPAVWAEDFEDPAITVCELLIRPHFEVEMNAYKRLSASMEGSRAMLDFEWGVPGAKPRQEHVECPYRKEDGRFVLDIPAGQEDFLLPSSAAIAASGLYPIDASETDLTSE